VNISSLQDGEVLRYNSTSSKWENQNNTDTTYTEGTGVSISPSNEISIGQSVGTNDSPRFAQLTVGGTPGINQGIIDLLAFNNLGTTTAAQIKGLLDDTNGGQIQFFTKEDGDPLTERMSILQNGLVSITTDGVGLLIASQDGVTEQGYIYNSGFGTKDFVIDAAVGSSTKGILFRTGSGNRMRISDTGNVGIGTNNPGARLHVYGGGGVWITNADENITHFNYQNLNKNYIRGTYTEISGPLEVLGNIFHRGIIIHSSDDRLKSYETDVSNATSLVMKMNPKFYKKHPTLITDDPEPDLSGVLHFNEYGFIAQELNEDPVLSHFVKENPDDNIYHVNYVEMIPLLVQTIKDLNYKVENLESENTIMKNALNQLLSDAGKSTI